MKKAVVYILIVAMLFTASLFMIGCGENGSDGAVNSVICLEHDFVLLSSTATCDESGIETYQCSICGKTKTETVPARGHYYDPYFCKYCDKLKDECPRFYFNKSVLDASGYRNGSLVLYISSSVSNDSTSVSLTIICKANYTVTKTFMITFINKNEKCVDGYLLRSSVFDSSMLRLVQDSITLQHPYSSSNEYYINITFF